MSDQITVLLADSDRAIRIFAQQALEETGCRVHATDSIGGLMDAARDNQFTVLATEVFFLDGNVFNHLDEIKSLQPQISVVVMSARKSFAMRAQQNGFAYLHKPFAGGELVKGVRQASANGRRGMASLAESAHFHVERLLNGDGINGAGGGDAPHGFHGGIHGRIISEVEKPLIETILRHAGGNQLRAAEMLGLNRNTLRKKIRMLGIDVHKKETRHG